MAKFISHKAEFQEALEEQLQNALNAIGMDASSTAGDECPVDTGRLKNSITYGTKSHCNTSYPFTFDGGSDTTEIRNVSDDDTVFIGTNVEYAPCQEFGTSTGVPAKHFLKWGITAHLSHYRQIIRDALKGK